MSRQGTRFDHDDISTIEICHIHILFMMSLIGSLLDKISIVIKYQNSTYKLRPYS